MRRRAIMARLATALAVLAGLTSCGSSAADGSVVSKAEDTGELTIGIRFTQPGMSERTLDGRFVGFDVDVARYVAAELGVDSDGIRWRDVLAADRESALASGKLDLVVSTYSITPKRQRTVRFAGPYFTTGQSLLVRLSETDITGPESLNGKKLCSVAGTTSAEQVKRRFAKRVKLVEYPRDPDCVTALLAQLVDAVTTDETILAGYVTNNPELLKVVGPHFSTERYGIGLRKDDVEGQQAVNEAIREMIASGEWRRAAQRALQGSGLRIPAPPAVTEK